MYRPQGGGAPQRSLVGGFHTRQTDDISVTMINSILINYPPKTNPKISTFKIFKHYYNLDIVIWPCFYQLLSKLNVTKQNAYCSYPVGWMDRGKKTSFYVGIGSILIVIVSWPMMKLGVYLWLSHGTPGPTPLLRYSLPGEGWLRCRSPLWQWEDWEAFCT